MCLIEEYDKLVPSCIENRIGAGEMLSDKGSIGALGNLCLNGLSKKQEGKQSFEEIFSPLRLQVDSQATGIGVARASDKIISREAVGRRAFRHRSW
jgi:hypothetical protein